jgi:anti-sigma factor ChrR (cupin superfamily)
MMEINSDYNQIVFIDTKLIPWQLTDAVGVTQRILEQANSRSTSVLKLEAGGHMPLLSDKLGSEIIVLEGELLNNAETYSTGTYIKLPSGSGQNLSSEQGCILFVKCGYIQNEDRELVRIDTQHESWRQGLVEGLSVMPLSEYGSEHTALVRWQPGTIFNSHRHWGGEEIYVLEGVFEDQFGRYPHGSWLRNPHLSQHAPFSNEGCVILVKVGHLPV